MERAAAPRQVPGPCYRGCSAAARLHGPMPPSALVIQTAFLGDVVLTTPLLQALAERHGPVDIVATPQAAALLETHPAVRQAIAYDKGGRDRGLGGLLVLARRLRAARYDVAYLPHRSLRTAVLAALARIPRRVGFHDGWPLLYTETRRRPEGGHEIDRILALAEVAPHHQTRPTLGITASDQAAAVRLLGAAGVGTPFVALAPGSIWATKRWAYYPELANALARRGVPVAVVGGPEDASLGEAIVAGVRRNGSAAANACGRLALRESAALIARAAVLVTNDSAPTHLGAAVETPTVAIFGPTVPAFGFAPRGPHDQAIGLDGLECRPCHHHGPPTCPLGHHLCMQALRVEDVMRAIEETGALRRRD
ncbi:MAG: lipopolysaccharide heptosyltransferase II [Gemmatimonadales bacterium]